MFETLFFLLFYIFLPVLLLLGAMFAGNFIAARHEADLRKRNATVAHIRATDTRMMLDAKAGVSPATLVTSEVTLGIDHFRGFLGKLKNIFGGEVRSYQTTLDRARREAVTRIMEQAHAKGFNAVANLRVDFADIGGNATMTQKAAMVTILAVGTAYHAETHATAPLATAAEARTGS